MLDLKKVIIDSDKNKIMSVRYVCKCDLKKAFETIKKIVNENHDLIDVYNTLGYLCSVADDCVICFI